MTIADVPKKKVPVIRISAETVPAQAFGDILNGARLYELWLRFAFHDIRQRFRRSALGPFWLTLSMGILVGTLGFVFSTLFREDIAKTLPYIATGIIFWGLLTTCINDGTTVFISAESDIRNLPIPHVPQPRQALFSGGPSGFCGWVENTDWKNRTAAVQTFFDVG
jgi:hypothetical protein